jgi:hypothetical protein
LLFGEKGTASAGVEHCEKPGDRRSRRSSRVIHAKENASSPVVTEVLGIRVTGKIRGTMKIRGTDGTTTNEMLRPMELLEVTLLAEG